MERTRLQRLRILLKQNKIFFETILTLLLGIMAIIISISALQVSYHQNQMNEMQNQPQFSFILQIGPPPLNDTHIINDNRDWVDDSIIITKTGSSMTDFSAQYFVFVKTSYSNKSFSKEVMIPINYYSHPSIMTDSNGEINKIVFSDDFGSDNPKGNLKFIREVFGNFYTYAENKGDKIDYTIERYIEVKYKDIFGIQRDNFYFVDYHGISRLSDDKAKKIVTEYDIDKTFYINGQNPYLPGERWDDSYYDVWYKAIQTK